MQAIYLRGELTRWSSECLTAFVIVAYWFGLITCAGPRDLVGRKSLAERVNCTQKKVGRLGRYRFFNSSGISIRACWRNGCEGRQHGQFVYVDCRILWLIRGDELRSESPCLELANRVRTYIHEEGPTLENVGQLVRSITYCPCLTIFHIPTFIGGCPTKG